MRYLMFLQVKEAAKLFEAEKKIVVSPGFIINSHGVWLNRKIFFDLQYSGSVRGVQGVKMTPRFLRKTPLQPWILKICNILVPF